MCDHPVIQADNYGQTCMICKEVIEGYGFWAKGSATCVRHFPDQDGYCIYCGEMAEH